MREAVESAGRNRDGLAPDNLEVDFECILVAIGQDGVVARRPFLADAVFGNVVLRWTEGPAIGQLADIAEQVRDEGTVVEDDAI
ncbi:MAG: hypothetical protein M5R42_04640, partial [Rhodocyclaceae bacterium]|nr:hypothetical protein [Rhodocyclaceae bacterium]